MSIRILVIEADVTERDLMRTALEHHGYDVMVAADGVRGYDMAVAVKPDLIVTDIQMPGADGIHVVRRVRDTPELRETRILVTTSFGTGSATFSLQQGADAYEPTPINLQSFLTTVERVLASKNKLRAA